jgi:hypothetical protein
MIEVMMHLSTQKITSEQPGKPIFTAADEQATRRRPASSYQANLNIYDDPSGKTFAIRCTKVSNNMLHLTLIKWLIDHSCYAQDQRA